MLTIKLQTIINNFKYVAKKPHKFNALVIVRSVL